MHTICLPAGIRPPGCFLCLPAGTRSAGNVLYLLARICPPAGIRSPGNGLCLPAGICLPGGNRSLTVVNFGHLTYLRRSSPSRTTPQPRFILQAQSPNTSAEPLRSSTTMNTGNRTSTLYCLACSNQITSLPISRVKFHLQSQSLRYPTSSHSPLNLPIPSIRPIPYSGTRPTYHLKTSEIVHIHKESSVDTAHSAHTDSRPMQVCIPSPSR